ncbi:hypothetical protein H6F86_07540 [Phormidium sp. FACHB-592]|uniref:Uncharacterized protein n=1 Tax=Stenomitos frigidus AS-A4 TaxID=2933935 RepID=A0ABV0KGR9_9CYAN|nr:MULTISPECIES: hypothetical protein [Cyanophyceae]MBD2037412.1 hypothetical protein [Leptolyngbya sp. FACHB-321]MBD2073742.1 hypothetical protein [Phormidium sp. FACHB-592]
MSPINLVVQKAICRGYLTAEAEQTLCEYFNSNCNLQDITALTMLQRTLISGQVKRLSNDDQIALTNRQALHPYI